MLIRPATDRNHERAQLGLVCVAFDLAQRAAHLGPKSGKVEYFLAARTTSDSRQLGNPEADS